MRHSQHNHLFYDVINVDWCRESGVAKPNIHLAAAVEHRNASQAANISSFERRIELEAIRSESAVRSVWVLVKQDAALAGAQAPLRLLQL